MDQYWITLCVLNNAPIRSVYRGIIHHDTAPRHKVRRENLDQIRNSRNTPIAGPNGRAIDFYHNFYPIHPYPFWEKGAAHVPFDGVAAPGDVYHRIWGFVNEFVLKPPTLMSSAYNPKSEIETPWTIWSIYFCHKEVKWARTIIGISRPWIVNSVRATLVSIHELQSLSFRHAIQINK